MLCEVLTESRNCLPGFALCLYRKLVAEGSAFQVLASRAVLGTSARKDSKKT
jgi:hypothetical protein